jgi:hypothetical protein
VCGFGLFVNEAFAVTLTVNVLAPPGSLLSNKAELIEGIETEKFLFAPIICGAVPIIQGAPLVEELNPNNDTGISTKPVQGGRIVNLFWQQPSMAPANADAARNAVPNLNRVSPVFTTAEAEASAESIVPQEDNACTLVRVIIYKSDQPNVQATLANIWKIVAPDKVQATMAAAPAGSFFRLANVWNCNSGGIENSNGSDVESGRSNERNSSGALIPFITGTPLKQGKALIVTGESFASGAKLLINGTPQKTTVESSTRLFCKKAGKKVRSGNRLQVQNADGGLSPEIIYP